MKKPIEWSSVADGKNYDFKYEIVKGKHILTANGVPNKIKIGFMSSMLGFDEGFTLDGKEARLVIGKKGPDVVLNGVYLQSGKPYIKRPAWAIAFAIACLLIPIISLGGAIPFLLGIGGAALCISVSRSTLPTVARVLLCTVITGTAWILWFIMVVAISLL